MNQNSNKFKQTNAFARQYGLLLGLWGIVSLAVMVAALKWDALSFLNMVMYIGSPILAGFFTVRFRRSVSTPEEGFSFGRGFLFTFITGLYASIWIAVFVFVYLAYIDHGFVFALYEDAFKKPEVMAQLRQSGMLEQLDGLGGIAGLVDGMRRIPPANYAGIIIYMTVLSAPFISAAIALICRRSPKFN